MQHYVNDRRQLSLTLALLPIGAILAVILAVLAVTRWSACNVEETSAHHELLK